MKRKQKGMSSGQSNTLFLTNQKFSNRSSRPEVFCRKGVLGNFAKFTGKHLCQSLFFNKVTGCCFCSKLKEPEMFCILLVQRDKLL